MWKHTREANPNSTSQLQEAAATCWLSSLVHLLSGEGFQRWQLFLLAFCPSISAGKESLIENALHAGLMFDQVRYMISASEGRGTPLLS